MKENKYDNEEFFKKYSEMNRSVNGLKGAGEWSELQKVLPDFEGLRVLDLGCGYGWHCLYAAQNGAKSVLGVDISKRMLKSAMEKNSHERITYRQSAMEDLDFPDGSFDVVISSLAFHYVKDFEPLVGSISRWLVPGGGVGLLGGAPCLYGLRFPGLVLCRGWQHSSFPGGQLLL